MGKTFKFNQQLLNELIINSTSSNQLDKASGGNHYYWNPDNKEEKESNSVINLESFDEKDYLFSFNVENVPILIESLKNVNQNFGDFFKERPNFRNIITTMLGRLTPRSLGMYSTTLSLINKGVFKNDTNQYISANSTIPKIFDVLINIENYDNKTETYYFFDKISSKYNEFITSVENDLSIYFSDREITSIGDALIKLNASKYKKNKYDGVNASVVSDDIKRLSIESVGNSYEINQTATFISIYVTDLGVSSLTTTDISVRNPSGDANEAAKLLSIIINFNDYLTEKINSFLLSLVDIAKDIIATIVTSRLTSLEDKSKKATADDLKKVKQQLEQGSIDTKKLEAANSLVTGAADAAQNALIQSRQADPFELTRFNVQCFMLDYIDRFVAKAEEVRKTELKVKQDTKYAGSRLPHDGKVILIKGRSYELLNKLFGTENKSKFLELSNEKLSYLIPKIRLHKVLYGVNGSIPTDYVIPFSTNAGWASAVSSSNLLDTIYATKTIESSEPYVSLSDREFGVGIKSFTWDYEGSNPVSARKDISATLTLKALNFDALCRQFPIKDKHEKSQINFKYLDLILRSGPKFYTENKDKVKESVFSARNAKYNPHYFTYRIDLGFQELLTNAGLPVSFTDPEIQAINENNVTLCLTLIDHKFVFNQDGTINLEIKYRAYFEAVMNDNEADVLADPKIIEDRAKREEKLESLREACEINFEDDQDRETAQAELKKVYEDFAKIEFQELKYSYGRIIDSLRSKEKINFALIDKAKIGGFALGGRNAAFTGVTNTSGSQDAIDFNPPVTALSNSNTPKAPLVVTSANTKDEIKKAISTFLQKNAPVEDQNGKILISYFFLSDLIEIMVDNIINVSTPNSISKHINYHSRVVLASMTVDVLGSRQSISIGDIPISVDYFSEWFLNRVVAEKRTTYHLLTFLRDIASHMITDLFSSKCASAYNRSPTKIQMTNFILKSTAEKNNIEFFSANYERSDSGVFDFGSKTTNQLVDLIRLNRSIIQATASQYLFHYTMIYALSTLESEERNNNPIDDSKLGIYHIGYGRNKGIVKKLDFERTEIKGLRELNFIRESDGTGLSQLQSTYNANVTTVGSYLFFPGERVYIDPTGFGNSLGSPNEIGSIANQLGLGGYHYIYRVSNSIVPGKFETTFKAKWESSGLRPGKYRTPAVGTGRNASTNLSQQLANCQSVSSAIITEYKPKVEPINVAGQTIKDAEAGLIKTPEANATEAEKQQIQSENDAISKASSDVLTEISNGTISPNLSKDEYTKLIKDRITPPTSTNQNPANNSKPEVQDVGRTGTGVRTSKA